MGGKIGLPDEMNASSGVPGISWWNLSKPPSRTSIRRHARASMISGTSSPGCRSYGSPASLRTVPRVNEIGSWARARISNSSSSRSDLRSPVPGSR